MSGVSVLQNPFSILGDGDDEPSAQPQKAAPKAAAPAAKPKTDNKGRRNGTGEDKKLPQKTRGIGGSSRDTGDRKRDGKRQFDRHSGSGRDAKPKREGRGKGNWGAVISYIPLSKNCLQTSSSSFIFIFAL